MEVKPFKIKEYQTSAGRCPYRDWLGKLEKDTRVIIEARILKFKAGNLGNYKFLGSGIYEAKFSFGSGYRVYFGIEGQNLILLLLGGDKGSQKGDILKAHRYWTDYRSEKE